MARREALEAVAADRRPAHAERLVHREHEAGLLERVVERVERGVAEVDVGEVVRPHDDARQPERGRVAGLGRGERRIALRDDGHPGEPARVGRAVSGDPLVVRGARRRRLARVELGQERHEQSDRRVQHHRVDALRVHRPQVRRRVEAVLEQVGEHRRSRRRAGTASWPAGP